MAGLADTAKLIATLELNDRFTPVARRISASVGQLEGRFSKLGSTVSRGLGTAAHNLAKFGVAAAAGITGLAVGAVKVASDYEQAFAGVRKTVEATDQELRQISDDFLRLSTIMPVSATDLARIGEQAGALGVSTKNITEFTRVTALLGETTDLTSEQAATSLGVIQNVLKLTEAEYSRFGSALVELGNKGASTESQIIAIAERSGAGAKLIGLTTQQVLGLASAVASLGIEEEAGGSSLQNFYLNLQRVVAGGGDKLQALAEVAGVSAKTFADAWEKDAGGAIANFFTQLGKLDKSAQLKALSELGFTDIRITRTLLGLANNSKLLTDQLGYAEEGWRENNALTEEANKKFATLQSQMKILRNTITRVGIAFGTGLIPPLQRVTKLLAEEIAKPEVISRFETLGKTVGTSLEGFVREFGPKIPQIVAGLTSGFAQVADILRQVIGFAAKIDWAAINAAFQIMAVGSKALLTAFLSLPPWVQTAVVTGWGLNKLTGGALTSVFGQVAGGLTKGLIGSIFGNRGATPANPVFTKDVSLGGRGGLAGATGGSAGSAAGKFILGASGALIAFEVVKEFKAQVIDPGLDAQSAAIVEQTRRMIAENPYNARAFQTALNGVEDQLKFFNAGPLNDIFAGQQIADLKATAELLRAAIAEAKTPPGERGAGPTREPGRGGGGARTAGAGTADAIPKLKGYTDNLRTAISKLDRNAADYQSKYAALTSKLGGYNARIAEYTARLTTQTPPTAPTPVVNVYVGFSAKSTDRATVTWRRLGGSKSGSSRAGIS